MVDINMFYRLNGTYDNAFEEYCVSLVFAVKENVATHTVMVMLCTDVDTIRKRWNKSTINCGVCWYREVSGKYSVMWRYYKTSGIPMQWNFLWIYTCALSLAYDYVCTTKLTGSTILVGSCMLQLCRYTTTKWTAYRPGKGGLNLRKRAQNEVWYISTGKQ